MTEKNCDKIKVVIPASGIGARFGTNTPKQFLQLEGMDILQHTISAFETLNVVDEIAVAIPTGYTHVVQAYGFNKVRHIVEGGTNRAESVFSALQALPKNTGIVLIHDGVRPFVTGKLVHDVVAAVKKYGAAIACTPVTNTIKQTNSNNIIEATPDRSQLWSAQTPQGFTYDIIIKAYEQGTKDGILHQVTDDSTLVERLGIPVYVAPGSSSNIKITTTEDMVIAKALLNLPTEVI